MFQIVRDLMEQLGPIETDRRPVLAKTQDRAASRVRHVAWLLERMAETIESEPWNDAIVDTLDRSLAQALELAGQSLATFRETRGCGGEG